MRKSKSPFGESKSPKRENQLKSSLASEFGTRLREAAQNSGYSQTRLAQALSLPTSSMGRYWNGERLLPVELLFRVADCLSVDPRWLGIGERQLVDAGEMSEIEAVLLAYFRGLSNPERQHVLQSAAILAGKAHPGASDAPTAQPPTLHSPHVPFRGASPSDDNA